MHHRKQHCHSYSETTYSETAAATR